MLSVAARPRTRLGERARDAIACPDCRGRMEDVGSALSCVACGMLAAIRDGQVDLRPSRDHVVTVGHVVGPTRPTPFLDRVGPLRPRAGASVAADWSFDETHGARMTPTLFSHVPDPPAGGGLLVDLGCGEGGVYARRLRGTGFEYVGVDVVGTAPDILGDAHRLPFRDGSVDVVVAISVLEHLRVPAVALAEVARVLRPGGTFIGSVALIEPFHMDSYLHHTHLGTVTALAQAGFDIEVVAPTDDWSGLQAFAEMALFPGFWRLTSIIATPFVVVLEAVSRLWWEVIGRTRRLAGDRSTRTRQLASGLRFVARRAQSAHPQSPSAG